MNRTSDSWAPRRHGFDDDGPADYAQRQRTQRSFGRTESDFEQPAMASPDMNSSAVDATVKWFKDEKGFGFVELSNGQGDAFLHATALHAAGADSVPPGAKLKVIVGAGPKGPQVSRVLSVDASTAVERPRRPPMPNRRASPDASTATSIGGTVKWFNEAKGFGFVAVMDGGKDIFVHISALNAAGIHHLDEGQPVNMQVVETPRGREAISISVG
jgi:CspA family cold shock protein